ncbi:MAG TPA: protein kinase [Thermoanaerobaculia bacterium]|nr:protein kinase [Thermoanaerobaculia bacterium]
MKFQPGTRLGPYEIVAPVGAGGMGEVYKARDTRLDRSVAIKVLTSRLAGAGDPRARFEREAKAISALNHPHICTLHDVGHEGDSEYLVMEYLEGESLSHRLAKGRLPLDQVYRLGAQIADALDKAHRRGIVHRDLKPGNIMLTRSGVKLLDFGLAKLSADATSSDNNHDSICTTFVAGASGHHDAGGPLTDRNVLIGTLPYMAPEQLDGKEADTRSDLWALGCVLYEMVAGKRAFAAAGQASLMSSILTAEPRAVAEHQPLAPADLDHLIRACLAKDPDDRWQSAHDVMAELRWIAERSSASGVAALVPGAPRRRRRERAVAAVAVLLALGLVAVLALRPRAGGTETTRFVVLSPLDGDFAPGLAVSPDGRQLAFVAGAQGRREIWVRPLAALEARRLPGTEGARFPFWSPDGRSLGFFANGKLMRVDLAGGAAQPLASANDGRGGAWSRTGVILFAPTPIAAIHRVPASGGADEVVTRLDKTRNESDHRWPVFLPDGRHFVYLARASVPEDHALVVGSLDGPEARVLVKGLQSSIAFAASSGYLLYVRERTLVAQPFDPDRLRFTGEPVPLAQAVDPIGEGTPGTAYAFFAADGSTLAYRAGVRVISQPTWFDRGGRELGRAGPPGDFDEPALSPDGRDVALDRNDEHLTSAVWRLDLERGALSRLSFGAGSALAPAWSPDGSRVAYTCAQLRSLCLRVASGAGNEEVLLTSDAAKLVDDWSPDGRFLLYEEVSRKTTTDLWLLPLAGERRPALYLQTPFDETHARFSPDGRFVAYPSNESGRDEVYVQTFPAAGGKWQISTDGGDQAQWRADGKELFFLGLDRKLRAVAVKTDHGFEPGMQRVLFEARTTVPAGLASRASYAVSGDGQRFLVDKVVSDGGRIPITVVLDWTRDLPARAK